MANSLFVISEVVVDDLHNLEEDIGHVVVTVDRAIVAMVEVVMSDGLRLLVIHSYTVANGVEVVVLATTDLTTLYQALNQQLLIYQQVDHDSRLVVFLQQLGQSLSLRYRTGITVEDGSLAILRQVGDIVLNDAIHHVVRHQITF